MSTAENLSSSADTFKPSYAKMLGAACAGCLSFLASLGIVIMVIRKRNGGLSTPYRRIIFGMSISDMIQSFAFMIGPFSLPAGTEHSLGIGNDATCRMDGFLLIFGAAAVPLYTCFLCLYYVCKLKFRMTNEVFERRFEWVCHVWIFIWAMAVGVVVLGLDIIGAANSNAYCIYTSKPRGCKYYPEIVGECEAGPRNEYVSNMFLLFTVEPASCFILICIFMGMLYWHAITWKRDILNDLKDPKTRSSKRRDITEADDDLIDDASARDKTLPSFRELGYCSEHDIPRDNSSVDENDNETSAVQVLIDMKKESLVETEDSHNLSLRSKTQQHSRDRVRKLSQLYTAETKAMVISYIAVFAITYMSLTTCQIYMLITGEVSAVLVTLTYFYPLGGLFNILVYTRPQVVNLRRKREGKISRVYAFLLVLRAGGEVPDLKDGLQRKSKMNKNMQDQTGDSKIGARFGVENLHSPSDSVNVMNGLSLSASSGENWSYVKGGSSRMVDEGNLSQTPGNMSLDRVLSYSRGGFGDNDDSFDSQSLRSGKYSSWADEDPSSNISSKSAV